MAYKDRFPTVIVPSKGTKAVLIHNNTYAQAQGELALATDTQNLMMADSAYRFQPVQTLDLAVVDMTDGQVVTSMSDGSIVYTF